MGQESDAARDPLGNLGSLPHTEVREARKEDLEFLAKLTREIGTESVAAPAMTINIHTNVDPSKLGGTDVRPASGRDFRNASVPRRDQGAPQRRRSGAV